MSICQNCGTHFITSALCTGCRPSTTPAAAPTDCVAPQKLPYVWQQKFANIERAGGASLPALARLPLPVRCHLRFNIFALLFGLLYYICKGMWKRGVSLALLTIALALLTIYILGLAGMTDFAAHNVATAMSALIFAYRANLDYYKQAVLGDDSWW